MRTAQIIPIEPYLPETKQRDREAALLWERFEDRIEARAAESWDTTGVSARTLWDMSQLTDWPSIARHFGLDGWA
ncbi:hypothetical protein CEW88_11640 [Alloyangia pacifica]|uniref:Uncharacterized protein n=2 Tax=Alloyangia pacifica TaxID=311180 RepID=A0A2U8HF06_9RHOB|nr:hypothetical protein CEW88_11640 [Alloyangia pacifica]